MYRRAMAIGTAPMVTWHLSLANAAPVLRFRRRPAEIIAPPAPTAASTTVAGSGTPTIVTLTPGSWGTKGRNPHFKAGSPRLARCLFRASHADGDRFRSLTSCVPETPIVSAVGAA